MSRARLATGLTSIAVVVPALLTALWWTRLPDPMASHWGPSGTADGSSPRWIFAVLAPALVGLMVLPDIRADKKSARWNRASAARTGVSFLLAGVTVLALRANLDAGSWREADDIKPLVGLAVAGVGLMAGYLLTRKAKTELAPTSGEQLPTIGLAPGERAMFTATDRSNLLLSLGAVMVLVGLVLVVNRPAPIGAIVCAVGLMSACMAIVRLRVDSTGVVVRVGPGLPTVRIPLGDIVGANCEHIEPNEWGGWGYRGSLRLMRRAAVVLRRGEGLVLTLEGDRKFAVTISDAADAAGLVNDLLRRHHPSPDGQDV